MICLPLFVYLHGLIPPALGLPSGPSCARASLGPHPTLSHRGLSHPNQFPPPAPGLDSAAVAPPQVGGPPLLLRDMPEL